MKMKKKISVLKSGKNLHINIPVQFVEALELEAGTKNIEIELDTNKKILIVRSIKGEN